MKKNLALFTLLMLTAAASFGQSILGFSKTTAEAELQTEKNFDANLNAKNVDQFIKDLSAVPHHVGSPGDKANAEYILNIVAL